ncbi:MAG: SufE family protein [Pseudomonadota bacterium]
MTALSDIVSTFELLGDWDTRYQYLVELGEQLPPLEDRARIEPNRVKACMSRVWVHAWEDPAAPGHIRFGGDCDTGIIKGVLALLIRLADGKTVNEIDAIDMDEFFGQLQLAEHLSPNRHVGVYAMVDLMKQQAAAAATRLRRAIPV